MAIWAHHVCQQRLRVLILVATLIFPWIEVKGFVGLAVGPTTLRRPSRCVVPQKVPPALAPKSGTPMTLHHYSSCVSVALQLCVWWVGSVLLTCRCAGIVRFKSDYGATDTGPRVQEYQEKLTDCTHCMYLGMNRFERCCWWLLYNVLIHGDCPVVERSITAERTYRCYSTGGSTKCSYNSTFEDLSTVYVLYRQAEVSSGFGI